MLLSIVIPVYNCCPVIIRCLKSIDYPDAEIIVVDDGSTDSSAKVVSEYASNHPNVRLIRKENGGVSSARNLGIESASGKYVMFIDADDYLVPDGISRIVDLAESNQADVVTYRITSISNDAPQDTVSIQQYPISTRTVEGEGEALLHFDVPDYHVVDAIFSLSPILENGIRFSVGLCLREDDVFCGMLFCHVKKIIVTDLPLYRYVRSSYYSHTHNQSVKKQRMLIDSGYQAMKIRGNYVKQYCPKAMPQELLKYMRWACMPKMAFQAKYSLSEYQDILQNYNELGVWPLDYNWIRAAGFDYSLKAVLKYRIKTFLCNHPRIAYLLLKLSLSAY